MLSFPVKALYLQYPQGFHYSFVFSFNQESFSWPFLILDHKLRWYSQKKAWHIVIDS